jgi:hypothetical protein
MATATRPALLPKAKGLEEHALSEAKGRSLTNVAPLSFGTRASRVPREELV